MCYDIIMHAYYALLGGCDGRKGVNTLVSVDGKETILPGKTSVEAKAGVRFLTNTLGTYNSNTMIECTAIMSVPYINLVCQSLCEVHSE